MGVLSDRNLADLKKSTLVLTQTADPETDMMFGAWRSYGLTADVIFWSCPKPLRAIRRLWVDGYLPGASLWYGKWRRQLARYDAVILHASERTRTIPRWIRKQKSDIRIIYWYWNPVNKQSLPELAMTPGMECWSFDRGDCERYAMHKNIQYYYAVPELAHKSAEYDVYFVGHDKGRSEEVAALKKQLEAIGLTVRVDLLREEDPLIPYNEVQRRAAKARAILEVNQKGQVGCTLRTLEALFLNKKLITNNKIIQNEPFYRPENVFVLGADDDLAGFMNRRSEDVSAYRAMFDIDAWFSNFFERTD